MARDVFLDLQIEMHQEPADLLLFLLLRLLLADASRLKKPGFRTQPNSVTEVLMVSEHKAIHKKVPNCSG